VNSQALCTRTNQEQDWHVVDSFSRVIGDGKKHTCIDIFLQSPWVLSCLVWNMSSGS
jgi:hypothetical protein